MFVSTYTLFLTHTASVVGKAIGKKIVIIFVPTSERNAEREGKKLFPQKASLAPLPSNLLVSEIKVVGGVGL